MDKLSHIELFAGCGGMGLGLNAAGFELYFANELSPMASETFAYNLLQEDLENLAEENKTAIKTLWIKSAFDKSQLKKRLRENPFEAKNGSFSDLNNLKDLKGKLLVGDIDQLLEWLYNNPSVIRKIKREQITLLSGGPPCQSFSIAGKREKDNSKNLLPLSFAKFAGLVKPKFVLLENVKGITAPFIQNDSKHYAWFEVAKAFASEGYVPVCMLLNSKYFGVAQHRNRFILLAIRYDIAKKLSKKIQKPFLIEAVNFYSLVNKNKESLDSISLRSLNYYDIENFGELYSGFIFPKVMTPEKEYISASEAIGDLKKTVNKPSFSKSRVVYRDFINKIFPNQTESLFDHIHNHEAREHNFEVKARFRLYQVINEFQNGNKKSAVDYIVGRNVKQDALNKFLRELVNHDLYVKNEEGAVYKRLYTIDEAKMHLDSIVTKKHSQRALKEDEPAPAQLTIPDDVCHYDMSQLRTLTVREMARFQSFPDWFVFKSKVTTGGANRKFEVPQYTQVGNAVPPLLAKALGESIINILKQIE